MRYGQAFWRSAPFIRLLIPLTAGVVAARYIIIPLLPVCITIAITLTAIFFSRLFSSATKYRTRWITGISFNLLICSIGFLLMYYQDIAHRTDSINQYVSKADAISIVLQDDLTEKPNSCKVIATIVAARTGHIWHNAKGNLLLYFKKDSAALLLKHGSQIVLRNKLQPIKGSGNPGSFDYGWYCASQGIYFQAYLQPNDFIVTGTQRNILNDLLIDARNKVLSIFRQYVPGQKETGVAEALLIGYRDDLDKDLVQAYSNTGVVHIIAISGLHLGMIYGLMVMLLKPFSQFRIMRWIKPLLILLVLWGFSLLAGAAASILRSAVMFSFIVIGESIGRKTNIYNTLAASAFCLLVYDPYFFWDVGFQLSYTAVTGIVLFMKPIYKLIYFKNKLLNTVWQLNAVTLSAQVLTLPVILYYFHQFPNLFLFTNFVAVPLSGFILYTELVLLLVYKIPLLNIYAGKIIAWLTASMDGLIERTSHLPGAVTDQIQVNLFQTIILYLTVCFFAWWLLRKQSQALMIGLSFMTLFFYVWMYTRIIQSQQQKLVVYNIPKHTAADIIYADHCVFIADNSLLHNEQLQRFHIQPSRLIHGVNSISPVSANRNHLIKGNNRTVLIICSKIDLVQKRQFKPDLVILNNNPPVNLPTLAAAFHCTQYVFGNNNPLWKIRYWKKQADSLHLRHHTIAEQGALEMDL